MFPGKKPFDRLKWAFKNVLDASLAWLFYDLRSPLSINGEVQGALAAHAPTIQVVGLEPQPIPRALCPTLQLTENTADEDEREEAAELLEWLSLAMTSSPRVLKGDSVDPFLCRYRPVDNATPVGLVHYRWHGFAPSAFVLKVLLAAMKTSSSAADAGWFALSGATFEGKGYTVLKRGTESMTWNYAG